ncbi:MAG TPA: phosphate acyltransferase PlsX [Clostridiaceae bacterium]|jgi:glycerol-3-phosphate acyltransferase PlsX|nr:phosphate acyltransferase PlsX [Clostridiaceae bacterium]
MRVLVDAMGGDNAPQAIVEGCLQALEVNKDFSITLIGERRKIEDQLIDKDYDKERLTIKHASEVITNNEVPTKAIKKKTDSSMVVGFNMLKNREGDVFVSAGSSGALLAGSVFILRRIRGISRPALGSIIPTKRGRIILLDSGLNSVIRPQNYLQFAYLGAAYMKSMFGVEDPRVGLVNVGTEEEKGTEAVKEANTLLRQSTLNYIGFIEGKDVFEGIADVVVTDGFTGNVMLKLIEGTATYFFREVKGVLLRNWKSRIGAAFLKKGFEDFKKSMDPDVNGGAPILGVDGLVIKSHGSSNARTIKHVILKAVTLAESDFISDIKKEIKNM